MRSVLCWQSSIISKDRHHLFKKKWIKPSPDTSLKGFFEQARIFDFISHFTKSSISCSTESALYNFSV